MQQALQRVRHIPRYQEIASVLIKHGFGTLVFGTGLAERLAIRRTTRLWAQRRNDPLPVRLRQALEELGPTFIKLGQILSTRPDVLPPEFIEELEKLQDDVPPAEWDRVRQRIEDELEMPLSTAFAHVDPIPIAAASLAQVHAARLHSGEEVVIKVLRPGIEETVEIDLEILFDLARAAQANLEFAQIADVVSIAEDFAATLHAEMDYWREARNAERFAENFKKEARLKVPEIKWELVTRRVLVMEYIHGIKLNNIKALDAAGHDRKQIAQDATDMIIKMILEDGFFHGDPHPGNLFIMKGGIIGVIDLGMVGFLDKQDRINLARLFIAASRIDDERVIDQLNRMGVIDYTVDRARLRQDVLRMLRKYQGLPLKHIRADELLVDLQDIIFKHKLRLPPNLWLLIKALVVMEGVGTRLDPNYDVFGTFEGYIRRLTREMISPDAWGPPLVTTAENWAEMMDVLPIVGPVVLRQLQDGQMQVRLEINHLRDIIDSLDYIVARLAMAVISASLILGLALLLPLVLNNPSNVLAVVIVIGAFVGASALGVYLVFYFLRTRKYRE
ncbi:MAG: AarF/ABC1/UbiB kinase family protein [Chloroflexi bacterium]|nr:AarF/ABC1/UbiB kinase family protein [Chloroflexota bacterium]